MKLKTPVRVGRLTPLNATVISRVEPTRHGGVIAMLPKDHPNHPHSGGGAICDDSAPQRIVFIDWNNIDRITCPKCSVLAVVMIANNIWPDSRNETHDEFRARLAKLMDLANRKCDPRTDQHPEHKEDDTREA